MKCDKEITQERIMATEIKYRLLCVTGPDTSYQISGFFNSEMVAKNHALNIKDREEQEYKIESVVTTTSILDIFTVPAHILSIDEIAEDIITMSDGSFYVEWGEDYSALSLDDQAKVEEIVWQEIDSCACCGWHFNNNHLSSHDNADGQVCDSCYNDLEEAEEDEEEQ
jgi:hypothetical protein